MDLNVHNQDEDNHDEIRVFFWDQTFNSLPKKYQ